MGPWSRKKLKESLLSPTGVVIGVLVILLLTITLHTVNLFGLLAAATSSLSSDPETLYFTAYNGNSLQVGADTNVDININARVPINVVGITVKFPPDMLEVVGFSKKNSFLDLWTEETSIKESAGEVKFSGGTTQSGGLTGVATALTLTVEAKRPGTATLSFEDAQVYASDGTGTLEVSKTRSLTFTISASSSAPIVSATSTATSTPLVSATTLSAPKPLSADFNGDGKVDLTDMTILILHIFAPYDSRYDLNTDGSVNFADLPIFMSKMGGGK